MTSHLLHFYLLICLLGSDNDLGGDDASRDVLYVPRGRVDLVCVVFSKYLLIIRSAIKKLLEARNK